MDVLLRLQSSLHFINQICTIFIKICRSHSFSAMQTKSSAYKRELITTGLEAGAGAGAGAEAEAGAGVGAGLEAGAGSKEIRTPDWFNYVAK